MAYRQQLQLPRSWSEGIGQMRFASDVIWAVTVSANNSLNNRSLHRTKWNRRIGQNASTVRVLTRRVNEHRTLVIYPIWIIRHVYGSGSSPDVASEDGGQSIWCGIRRWWSWARGVSRWAPTVTFKWLVTCDTFLCIGHSDDFPMPLLSFGAHATFSVKG